MAVIGKINRSPDKPIFDLSDYNWLIEEWLRHSLDTASEETVNGYRQRIGYFRAWWVLVGESKRWLISEREFVEFEAHLRARLTAKGTPLAYNTRHDAIRRTRDMLAWAYQNDYTGTVNLAKWVVPAQGAPPLRVAATLEQLQRLLDAAQHTKWPARTMAILALLLGAGLRRRETTTRAKTTVAGDVDESTLAGLLIENIVFHAGGAGILTVTGKRTAANPSGVRQVAFDADVGNCLIRYLDELGETSGAFLRNQRNHSKKLGHKGVYRTVKAVIALAGLGGVIDACHQLRRNYSHYWIKFMTGPAGADFLRRNLGHKEFRQTTEYMMLDASDIVPHATSPLALIAKSRNVQS